MAAAECGAGEEGRAGRSQKSWIWGALLGHGGESEFDLSPVKARWVGVLIGLGCHDKTATTEWPGQQTFLSHGSGDWEVPGQGTGGFGSQWGHASWLAHCCLLCGHPHVDERA